ncbi:MAG: hypothetical protein ABFC21_01215 [Rectinema sp.]
MNKIALLDTNIIIHRETMNSLADGIGLLYRRLDQLGYEKCLHRISYEELMSYHDPKITKIMDIKSRSYCVIENATPICDDRIKKILASDKTTNDINDTKLINEVLSGRADILISEDRGILRKAVSLYLKDRIYTIDEFLESTEYLSNEQVEYKALSISQETFANINLADTFFDSFKKDYIGFEKWFLKKSDEKAYIYKSENRIIGFLYIKAEPPNENYKDISPMFSPKRRLKIGTFKVEFNGLKLGERFVKIVFDNAFKKGVDEIYVTMFDENAGEKGLQVLLEKFGFSRFGEKKTSSGTEIVLVRSLEKFTQDKSTPTKYFPYLSRSSTPLIAPIKKDYHARLFPDDFPYNRKKIEVTNEDAYRYALIKTYISWGVYRAINVNDIVLFYMFDAGKPAIYTSNLSSFGVVTKVFDQVSTIQQLKRVTNGKTAYTNDELQSKFQKMWYPLVIEFAYCGSLKKRPNRLILNQMGIFDDPYSGPRCLTPIEFEQMENIFEWSGNGTSIIID